MTATFELPCFGNSTHKINKNRHTITFTILNGRCKFKSFTFKPRKYSPGFKNRVPTSGGGPAISYDYDATKIPGKGHKFEYATDGPPTGGGNGTGVIKN